MNFNLSKILQVLKKPFWTKKKDFSLDTNQLYPPMYNPKKSKNQIVRYD